MTRRRRSPTLATDQEPRLSGCLQQRKNFKHDALCASHTPPAYGQCWDNRGVGDLVRAAQAQHTRTHTRAHTHTHTHGIDGDTLPTGSLSNSGLGRRSHVFVQENIPPRVLLPTFGIAGYVFEIRRRRGGRPTNGLLVGGSSHVHRPRHARTHTHTYTHAQTHTVAGSLARELRQTKPSTRRIFALLGCFQEFVASEISRRVINSSRNGE